MDDAGRITYATLEDYDKEALFRVFVEDFDKKYKVMNFSLNDSAKLINVLF